MEKEELEGKVAKIRNLQQYKDKSDNELETLVIKQADKIEQKAKTVAEVNAIDIEGLFSDIKEKRFGRQLLNKYLEEFSIDNISDKSLLKELIYLEVFQKMRLQASADKFQKENGSVPLQMLDSIHKNLDKIVQLKNSLGLTRNSNAEANDAFNAFELLMKKAKVWREENSASRTLVCVSKGTKVLLPNFTTKNIEDIKIDEEIVGIIRVNKQGLKLVKQKVLNTTYSGIKECLELTTNLGRKLICTPDHLIFSYYRAQKTKSRTQGYLPAENTLRRRIKTFNYISSVNDYYRGILVGLIKSDGWIDEPKDKLHPEWHFSKVYNICQSPKKELESIEFILKYFNFTYTKEFNDGGWGDGAFEYRISTKHTPTIDEIFNELFNNRDLMLGFLAGFTLGDGCVDKLGNISISQKNEKILLLNVINKLGLYYTNNKITGKEGQEAFGIRKQIPLVVPSSKKSLKYLNSLFSKGQHFIEEKIVSLKILEEKQEVYDLTTETENFIANGIIVHNCPHCSQMIMLKIRTHIWEAQKHPMFRDRLLGNPHLIKLYNEKKLTKADVAAILGVSPDYVDWMVEKWGKLE